MNDDQPAALDPRDLRRAFGNFATGVTIVTTFAADGTACGFTANSFSSVSIDPPLLLVNIAKSAYGCNAFTNASGFAVNILAAEQRELSNQFARAGADKFKNTSWYADTSASPILDGVVAWFDCNFHEQIDAGDHIILLGRVLQYRYNTHAPLGFCRGAYVSFGLTPKMLQLISSPGSLTVGAIIEANGKILLERDAETGQRLPPTSDVIGDIGDRASLLGKLAAAGVEVDLPFVYAAYHEDTRRFVYYLGEMVSLQNVLETDSMRFHEFDEITGDVINDAAVLAMLERFMREKQLGNYGIYIGDQHQGEIHPANPKLGR